MQEGVGGNTCSFITAAFNEGQIFKDITEILLIENGKQIPQTELDRVRSGMWRVYSVDKIMTFPRRSDVCDIELQSFSEDYRQFPEIYRKTNSLILGNKRNNAQVQITFYRIFFF